MHPTTLCLSTLLTISYLFASVHAVDSTTKLNKPALLKHGLGALLQDGLKAHLPKTDYHITKWAPGWIPTDCKRIAEKANNSASDIETFDVHFDDCSSPWILCRHTASPDPLVNFIENFGRIPVRARSHVKGAISLPETTAGQNHAYNDNGYIASFSRLDASHRDRSSLTMFIHETGHSLDAGAFLDSPLSSHEKWDMEYNHDSKVVDSYAASNFLEDVAQNVVIAIYDLVVPGGFAKVNKGWKGIQHQLALVKREQRDAGNLLVPGGRCTKRLKNSKPVQIGSKKDRKTAKRGQPLPPNVDLGDELDIIEPTTYFTSGPSRRAAIAEEIPSVDLADHLEVIVPRSEFSTEHICEH